MKLTELHIVPFSSYQGRQEARESIAGIFSLLDKPAGRKGLKGEGLTATLPSNELVLVTIRSSGKFDVWCECGELANSKSSYVARVDVQGLLKVAE